MADPKEVLSVFKGLALIAQAGLFIVLPLVFFIWLGQQAAGLWGGQGLFLILSLFLGLGVGFTLVYRIFFKEVDDVAKAEDVGHVDELNDIDDEVDETGDDPDNRHK